MRNALISTAKTEACGLPAPRFFPKIPAFQWAFFPVLVGLIIGTPPTAVYAQAPAASPTPVTAPQTSAGPAGAAETSAKTDTVPQAVPTGAAPAVPVSMPEAPKTTSGTGSALLPHDLSPYGMFMHADIIVQVVMVGLAFASLVTWTILLAKGLELAAVRSRAAKGLAELAEAPTLRDAASRLANPKGAVTRLARAALAETERSSGLAHEGIKDRASALLSRIEARAGRSMARGTGLLATIGSTAPFVGLFGTVWGIMNAFIGISKTNTTNLAVVAPGIAEALLATAFGLVAAIPAVIIYNGFARAITGYRSLLGDASTEVMRLLSRDLDRDEAPAGAIRRAAE